ncbi:MAG: hypothetical protein ACHQ51_00180 [Elusimicrobiota bacterium]
MRVIPSCEDLARSVSDGSYEEGPWHARVRLRLHMIACWICRRYTAQIRWIDQASKSVLAPPTGEDPDFKRRLIGRLKS